MLREIGNICRDNSAFVSSVSLNPPPRNNGLVGYQLKIGTRLDDACRECLSLMLKAKHLDMAVSKDFIVVY